MLKLDCFLRGLWRSIRYLSIIDGHNFVQVYENEDVEILRCDHCGYESVAYFNEELLK